MTEAPEIRPYRPGDEASILDAWNEIFPAQDGLPPRDLAYWRWQFERNPLGRTEVLVAEAEDRIVGQYASLPQRAVDEGEEITIGLIVDAFVLPRWRRSGTRPGIMVHLMQELHECWCGPHAKLASPGHSLLYGYPFPIWRLARRYVDSEMVRDLDVMFRELQVPGFEPLRSATGVDVEVRDRAGDVADELWRRAGTEVRFGIMRDAAYLDWRYADHPQKRYRLVVARDRESGAARGLAVYGRGGYAAVPDAGIVCDWLAPIDDLAAEDALLQGLEELALADGVPHLLSVLPQNDPRFLRWQRKGFLIGPPSHFLVMNTFQHHVRHLRDIWFQTLGDSDLV